MVISQKSETHGIILRMQEAVGAKDDLDLARKLGSKSRGYVSNWRKNNKVPAKAIEKASQISGTSFEKIRYGRENTTPSQQITLPSEMVQKVNEQISTYGDKTLSESACALGKIFDQLKPEQQVIMLTQASVMLLANGQESE